MKMRKVIVPVMVIVIALGLTFVLVKSRKVPKPIETPYLGPLVETVELVRSSRRVVVQGTGSAQSRREVNIAPQVNCLADAHAFLFPLQQPFNNLDVEFRKKTVPAIRPLGFG